jgi:hypothetical protein
MSGVSKIIVWSALSLAAFGCGGGGSTSSSPTSPTGSSPSGTSTAKDETAPIFSTPFLNLDQAVAFYVFGVNLPSGVQNPTFEIETADQTPSVFAVAPGTVINIANSSNGIDKTIFVFPSSNSIWDISYDHVSNVRVSVGQTITAGMQLGTVGVLSNGRGRTELQINRTDTSPVLAHCPTNFGTSSFNAAFASASQRINGSATVCTAVTVRP